MAMEGLMQSVFGRWLDVRCSGREDLVKYRQLLGIGSKRWRGTCACYGRMLRVGFYLARMGVFGGSWRQNCKTILYHSAIPTNAMRGVSHSSTFPHSFTAVCLFRLLHLAR